MFKWKNKTIDRSNFGNRMSSKNTVAYFVLGMAVLAMTFFGVCTPNQGGLQLDSVAAKVDGEKISFEEFNNAYRNAYQRYQRIYQDAFDPTQMKLAKNVMDNLVERYVVYKQARDAGVSVADSEVEDEILKQFKGENDKFDKKIFERNLKYYGFSEASFMELVRRDLTINKYRRFVGEVAYVSSGFAKMDFQVNETLINLEYLQMSPVDVKVSTTDEDVTNFLNEEGKKRVADYYSSNKQNYNKPKKVRASHILIAFKDTRRAPKEAQERSKEEATKIAGDVLAEARKPGANFGKLAAKYTDERSGKAKGGDLGFFGVTDMVKEFSDVAFAMKKGEISDVVESPFGFHVIKVTDIQPEENRSVEEATNEIAKKLIVIDRQPEILARRAAEILKELRENSKSSAVKEYGYQWQETKDFSAGARSIPGLGGDDIFQVAAFNLNKVGDVYPEVLESGEDRFLIRLKSRKNADFADFNDEKRDELARSSAFKVATANFSAMNKAYQDKLDKNGSIWRNADYLNIEQRRNQGGG